MAAREIFAAEILCTQALQAHMIQVVQPALDIASPLALTPSSWPGTGDTSPQDPALYSSCSLAQKYTSTRSTFEFLYNKTTLQICLMLCSDHITTTHLHVSEQQLAFHEALTAALWQRKIPRALLSRWGTEERAPLKPPHSRDNPDMEPTKPAQAGVSPFL